MRAALRLLSWRQTPAQETTIVRPIPALLQPGEPVPFPEYQAIKPPTTPLDQLHRYSTMARSLGHVSNEVAKELFRYAMSTLGMPIMAYRPVAEYLHDTYYGGQSIYGKGTWSWWTLDTNSRGCNGYVYTAGQLTYGSRYTGTIPIELLSVMDLLRAEIPEIEFFVSMPTDERRQRERNQSKFMMASVGHSMYVLGSFMDGDLT